MRTFDWRPMLLLLALAGSLALSHAPIAQDPAFHEFADRRALFGIPSFGNVASNLLFLAVGALGLRHCLRYDVGAQRIAWLVLFCGIALVGPGSGYYHRSPDDAALVWDRLPMAVAFMAFATALWGEHVDAPSARLALWPAVLAGVAGVAYWRATGDLRWYAWTQLAPFLVALAVLLFYDDPPARRGYLLLALALYAGAKLAELGDARMFELSGGLLSGHTLKHLLAAAGCYSILRRLQWQQTKQAA
jgi:hypothetical protein